jgi:branched-chain amino acid transport system permease protein
VKSFEIIIMIAIGGLGSIEGAVLGAVFLTVLPEAFRGFEGFRMIIYSLALILIMIYRPQGLLGDKSIFRRFRRKRFAQGRIDADDDAAKAGAGVLPEPHGKPRRPAETGTEAAAGNGGKQ